MRYLSWLKPILFRGTTAVLIFVVFMGAVCPPLYEGLLPHDHIFIGGPPPANWQYHHHDNPLAGLFGGGDADDAISPVAEPAILGAFAVESGQTGKVFSLYAAPSFLVLSVVGLVMLIPCLLLVCLPTGRRTVGLGVIALSSAEPAAPRPPPPRSRGSGQTPFGADRRAY